MLHFSFLPFYPPTGAWPTEALVGPPLPLVIGEVFAMQSPVATGLPTPATPLRLALVTGQPSTGWTVLQDNLLPIDYIEAQHRLMLNAVPRLPFPAAPLGRAHLALLQATGQVWAVSTAVQVYDQLPPATRLLRYRNIQTGVFFDYSGVLVFNQLRLPLEVERPQYRLTPIPQYDPLTGLNTPLVQRIDKQWTLRTAWLSSIQLEALQIALRHDNFELWYPANSALTQPTTAGQWSPCSLQGEAPVTWSPDAAQPLGQLQGNLRPFDFSALNGMFSIPILPTN